LAGGRGSGKALTLGVVNVAAYGAKAAMNTLIGVGLPPVRWSGCTTGSRVVRQVCDPAARGLEQSFVGDVIEGAQLQEVLRDRQAEDAAHRDQGAQVCVVPVQ